MRKSIGHLIALAALSKGINEPMRMHGSESEYVPARKKSSKANLSPARKKKKAKAGKKRKNKR